VLFTGRHERQLDPKGRLALPAEFKRYFEPRCYLAFGDKGCVVVYTPEEYETLANEMLEKVKRKEASRDALRAFAGNTFEATVDGQGRINVDRALREFASVETNSKVVVAGAIDRVEIWNVGLYDDIQTRGTEELKTNGF
jgi:MraZ protein